MYEEISNSNKAIIFFRLHHIYIFFYWLSNWRSPERKGKKLKNKKYIVKPSGKREVYNANNKKNGRKIKIRVAILLSFTFQFYYKS